MCRKHFGMTKREFLFEHDVVGVSTMLSQLLPKDDDASDKQKENVGEVNAINFL